MSVSSRVVLSVGLLMTLALGVVGYELRTVNQLRVINNELSNVSSAVNSALKMELDATELDRFFRRYLSRDEERRKENDQALNDSIENIDKSFRDLEVRQPSEASWEIAELSSAWLLYKAQIESIRQVVPKQGFDEFPPSLEAAASEHYERVIRTRDLVLENSAAKLKSNEALASQAYSVSLVAAAIFLILSAIITFLTVRAINAPLRELTRGTRSIATGQFSHRIPVAGPSEFVELARDFNSMSEKLGELDQMKKDFVAHVSHELKAPLAAIRQTLAVTLEEVTGPVNDAQRRLLQLSHQLIF